MSGRVCGNEIDSSHAHTALKLNAEKRQALNTNKHWISHATQKKVDKKIICTTIKKKIIIKLKKSKRIEETANTIL